MDISSNNKWPTGSLSNFAIHHFKFRDVDCYSMEGLLQSLKFKNPETQKRVCKLIGRTAKLKGSSKNKEWQKSQILWWQGKPMKRDSKDYQLFLDEAFASLSMNDAFEEALLATGDEPLTHRIGHNDITKTILTEKEFVSKLTSLRNIIRSENDNKND